MRKLYATVRGRLVRMRGVLKRKLRNEHRDDTEARVPFATIETLNTWRMFVRAYYLSCMLSAVTAGGTKISTGKAVKTVNEAIGYAVSHWKHKAKPKADGTWHRRDEPAWHDPNMVIRICRSAGFSNIADIEAAFSGQSKTFSALPTFRNYFAHRAGGSERAAQDLAPHYGISRTLRPSAILMSRPSGRPQPLLFEWIDHVLFTVEFLCT